MDTPEHLSTQIQRRRTSEPLECNHVESIRSDLQLRGVFTNFTQYCSSNVRQRTRPAGGWKAMGTSWSDEVGDDHDQRANREGKQPCLAAARARPPGARCRPSARRTAGHRRGQPCLTHPVTSAAGSTDQARAYLEHPAADAHLRHRTLRWAADRVAQQADDGVADLDGDRLGRIERCTGHVPAPAARRQMVRTFASASPWAAARTVSASPSRTGRDDFSR
jgi:hypothetical protein